MNSLILNALMLDMEVYFFMESLKNWQKVVIQVVLLCSSSLGGKLIADVITSRFGVMDWHFLIRLGASIVLVVVFALMLVAGYKILKAVKKR